MNPFLFASASVAALLSAGAPAPLNDPPSVEHQPVECALVARPMELCATVLDDGDIAKVRLYFRKPGEKEYFVTEMAFEGAQFCATLPAVKAGKLKSLEYYIQAIDTEYESKRTSTYQVPLQTEDECGFPAVQKDAKKAANIKVQATMPKQGTKLPDFLDPAGVTFTPAPGAKK
jgi:hypothetical protein